MSVEVKVILEENNAQQILDLMNTWGRVYVDFNKRSKFDKDFGYEIKSRTEEKPRFLVPAELKDLGFYNIRISGKNGKVDASFKQYRYYGLQVRKEIRCEVIKSKFNIQYECFYDYAEKNINDGEDEE